MFAEMLALSVMFWFVLIIGIIGLAILIEVDRVGWAAIVTIGLFAFFFWLVEGLTLESLKANSGAIAQYFAYYVTIGIGWSFGKWYLFLRNRRTEYNDLKGDFCTKKKLSADEAIPDNEKEAFKKFLDKSEFLNSYDAKRKTVIPEARNNKDRMTGGLFYCPISIVI